MTQRDGSSSTPAPFDTGPLTGAEAATPLGADSGVSQSASRNVTLPVARAAAANAGSRLAWLAWFVPVLAAMLVAAVFVQSRMNRGPTVEITFAVGSGLKAGDPVMFRGVRVGEVEHIGVLGDLSAVVVRARLAREASVLAREGTAFWIVRPELSLTKVSGLETLVGPRYVEAEPASGAIAGTMHGSAARFEFVGREEAPARAGAAQGGQPLAVPTEKDLVLTLHADRARSLSAGSPVQFRGMKVGQVLGMELDSSGAKVKIHAVVFEPYKHLVRANSQWWNASGFGLDFGLVGGLSLRTGSLESLITGGVSFATPDKPGGLAKNGQVFVLAPEAEKEWLEWAPILTAAPAKKSGTVIGREVGGGE